MIQAWLREGSRRAGYWDWGANNFKQCCGLCTDLVVDLVTKFSGWWWILSIYHIKYPTQCAQSTITAPSPQSHTGIAINHILKIVELGFLIHILIVNEEFHCKVRFFWEILSIFFISFDNVCILLYKIHHKNSQKLDYLDKNSTKLTFHIIWYGISNYSSVPVCGWLWITLCLILYRFLSRSVPLCRTDAKAAL